MKLKKVNGLVEVKNARVVAVDELCLYVERKKSTVNANFAALILMDFEVVG